jgi:hypothetical protein
MQLRGEEAGIKRSLLRSLTRRFFLRFHVTLIVLWTFCWGFATSKLFLALGSQSMPLRYGVALVVAYLMFLLAVRLWLQYTGHGRYLRNDYHGDVPLDAIPGPGRSPRPRDVGDIHPGGGNFGGGGASGSFESGGIADGAADSIAEGTANSVGEGIGVALEGGLPGLVIALVIMAGAALFMLVSYFVTSAPMILVDAAFEALLASGLIRCTRRIDTATWLGAVVRATVIPFFAVFILTLGSAAIAQHYVPQAVTLNDVVTTISRK